MPQKSADERLDDIIDTTHAGPDCGLCIFISSVAGLLWMLVRL